MKTITTVFALLLIVNTLCGCKPEKQFENAWVGNWKFVSVTDNATGSITTNTTNKEVITTFNANSNSITAINGGSQLFGKYYLGKKNKLTIEIQRGDEGGWPNGPWLDLYLEAMNKASKYAISNDGLSLTIETSDSRTISFTKM